MRIQAPTYTQTPNDLFDHWLPHLKEGELKVLLVIMRKTFGWHKIRDRISISQLMKLTGMARSSVVNSIKSLEQKGVIHKDTTGENGSEETYYELIVNEDSNNSYQSEFNTPPSPNFVPPPSTNFVPTKETLTKEKSKEQQQPPVVVVPENFSREEDIIFKNSKGETKSFSQSEVYQHFSSLPYSTSVIKEAIREFKSTPKIVNNFLKYLESMCYAIAFKSENSVKSTPKQKSWPEETKVKKEDLKHITGAEYLERLKKKNV